MTFFPASGFRLSPVTRTPLPLSGEGKEEYDKTHKSSSPSINARQ